MPSTVFLKSSEFSPNVKVLCRMHHFGRGSFNWSEVQIPTEKHGEEYCYICDFLTDEHVTSLMCLPDGALDMT